MSDYPVHLEVEPRVHLVTGGNRARFPEANCLLIDDEVLTLVDAGANIERILQTLHDLGHEAKDIQRIVISHFHIDHKGYAGRLSAMSDCEVLCHPLAERGITSFEGMVQYYGIDRHRFYDEWKALLSGLLPHVAGQYRVTGHFSEGKPIDCGKTLLYPVHCPGHTPDHTCFGINGYNTMLLVDIDLTKFGPWYGNITSDIDDFKQSIRKVIEIGPHTAISSHALEPVQTNVKQRLTEYLAMFDLRDRRIVELVSEGHDTIENLAMVPTIYPRIPMKAYIVFEEYMLQKHIDSLVKRGMLETESGRLRVCRS